MDKGPCTDRAALPCHKPPRCSSGDQHSPVQQQRRSEAEQRQGLNSTNTLRASHPSPAGPERSDCAGELIGMDSEEPGSAWGNLSGKCNPAGRTLDIPWAGPDSRINVLELGLLIE